MSNTAYASTPVLPQDTQTVRLILSESRVFREQSQILADRLPDKHAVKRIFVLDSRQLMKSSGVMWR